MMKINNNPHLFRVSKAVTVSGELLHFKLNNVATEVKGVDISKDGIRLLQKHGAGNLVVGNIEQIDEMEELKGFNFDIILLTEVLEHLNNPPFFAKS